LVSSIIRIYLFSLFLQAWSDFPQLIQQFCRMFTVDGEYEFPEFVSSSFIKPENKGFSGTRMYKLYLRRASPHEIGGIR
jgi:hypothetical protein